MDTRTSRKSVLALVLAAGLTACSAAATPEPPPVTAAAPTSAPATPAATVPWPELPSSELPSDTTSKMQTEVESWVDKGLLPGVTVAVVSPDGVWSTAAGVDGAGAPLEPSSGMALASITKTFTAAEVMLLAERGVVDLDAPASTYLDLPQVANGVTLRQLLGHRSGIPDPGEEPYESVFTHPDEHWSAQQFLAPVAKATDPPGKKFSYDNTNFVLLGLVVDAVTGEHTATVFTHDLWEPLGLGRLAYQDQQRLEPPLAMPGADDQLSDPSPEHGYLPSRAIASALGSAGGVAGDAESTARWGYGLYGARLLSPASVDQMTDFDDQGWYGLATINFAYSGNFAFGIDGVGHDGELPGFRTVLAVIPSHHLSIAILTPSDVGTIPYVKWLVKAGMLTGGEPAATS